MDKLSALNTLREKLGEDGVNALLEVIEEERERMRDYLFRILEERFARRLAEEMGKLRSEMYKLFARHSAEVDEKIEGLRSEMHSMKADVIKWMFVFWVSQTLVIIGVIFALMRFLR